MTKSQPLDAVREYYKNDQDVEDLINMHLLAWGLRTYHM